MKEERLSLSLQLQYDSLSMSHFFSLGLQRKRQRFVVHLHTLQHKGLNLTWITDKHGRPNKDKWCIIILTVAINPRKSRSLTVRFVFCLPSVYRTSAFKAFVPLLLHLLFDVIQTLLEGLFLGRCRPLPCHDRAQPARICALKSKSLCPSKTFNNNWSS